MAKAKRKRLKLNVKFINGAVACAKSPGLCNECDNNRKCEKMELFYYPFNRKDIAECFKNSERKT